MGVDLPLRVTQHRWKKFISYSMLKEFWKNTKLKFLPKMGVALPRPSGWPNITENNSENCIDHKLPNETYLYLT